MSKTLYIERSESGIIIRKKNGSLFCCCAEPPEPDCCMYPASGLGDTYTEDDLPDELLFTDADNPSFSPYTLVRDGETYVQGPDGPDEGIIMAQIEDGQWLLGNGGSLGLHPCLINDLRLFLEKLPMEQSSII
jgi:hypothetical protein